MELLWTSKMVDDLNCAVNYLKKNKIGTLLEILADYFIERHNKKMKFEDYEMSFESGEINIVDKIGDAEYKLAYLCQLVVNSKKNIKYKSLSSRITEKKLYKDVSDFTNIYNCLSFIIKYSINKIFKLHIDKTDYKLFFLSSLVREKLEIKNEEIVIFSYFLTLEIKDAYINKSTYFDELSTLLVRTEIFDVSIFSNKEIREICDLLKTKRTIFFRIMLVLCYEISKMNITMSILDPLWLTKNLKFKNYEDFTNVITSPLIETLIFLTSEKIIE